MRALILALALIAPVAQAETLSLTCTADQRCIGTDKCTAISGDAFRFSVTGKVSATGTLSGLVMQYGNDRIKLKDISGGNGFFDSLSGIGPNHSALMFSIHSNGFMLTQHGVWDHKTTKGIIPGSPSVMTFFGPPCAGFPQGDE